MIASYYADKLGRRKLLIIYSFLMFSSGIIFFVTDNYVHFDSLMCFSLVPEHLDISYDHLFQDLGLVIEQYLQVLGLCSIFQELLESIVIVDLGVL